jgi:hypothetical protein
VALACPAQRAKRPNIGVGVAIGIGIEFLKKTEEYGLMKPPQKSIPIPIATPIVQIFTSSDRGLIWNYKQNMHVLKGKYLKIDGIKTVAILADPGCRAVWKKSFPKLLEHVWRLHKPELFLVAGDLAVEGTPQEYQDFISALEGYSARIAAVPGDHDKSLKNFRSYFGSTRKILDIGRWRFIGLNTANRMFLKSEASFLEKHLRPGTMIFSHVPPGIDGWTFHSLPLLSSNRFLSTIDRHSSMIKAAFFGHIHAYSRQERSGVPLIVTGGTAESFTVKNNQYAGPGFFQIMIFHPATGKLTLCKMDLSEA